MNNISNVLDIGSGTGHHVDSFKENNIKVKGIDSSKAMVKKSKTTYPENDYVHGDALNGMTFHTRHLHILLVYILQYIK